MGSDRAESDRIGRIRSYQMKSNRSDRIELGQLVSDRTAPDRSYRIGQTGWDGTGSDRAESDPIGSDHILPKRVGSDRI
ncbi:unnamed protein product [Toxocara canis]|uniref:DUF1508 domain-containing protein n=1 Tax=Toxocara canis TaxID=6265 RepID=A0A183TZQ6_TOXCA|nr:unnamed protein product [Toxocara canis]